jgi:hypothetical protein
MDGRVMGEYKRGDSVGLKEGRRRRERGGAGWGGGGGGRAEGRLRMPTHKEEIPRNTYLIPSLCSRALFRFNLGWRGGGTQQVPCRA